MTFPNQIANPPQTGAGTVVNENFGALAPLALFAFRAPGSSGLTWAYWGGNYNGTAVADGSVSLTASSTNYIVAHRTTGVVTAATNTTNFDNTSTYARVAVVVTNASAVTSQTDRRAGVTGVFGTSGAAGDALTANPLSQFAATTSAQLRGVLSDETGTGAAVFADAPTLVNPVVGTQSAGDSTTKAASTAFVAAAVAAAVAGLSWKQAVRAATTAAGTLASSFENGDTIDGVTLATGDRILVKNQASATENGIYTVNASGAPTRATDADSGAELVNASVYVSEGTTNADTQWTCTTNAPITIGATNLTFAQLSSSGPVDAANVTYTPTTLADWDASADPGDVDQALDQLAERVADLEAAPGGGGGGTKTYAFFTPMTAQPPASNAATFDTRNSIAVLDFDDTTEESTVFVGVMPEGASLGSGLIARLHLMATTATTGDIRFGVQFERMNTDADSDSFDTAAEATIATSGTSGVPVVLSITNTNIDGITAGDAYRIKVYRDTSGADTVTGDVELIAVEVRSAA